MDLVAGVEQRTGVTMEEMSLPEEQVLEGLNKVTTAKRVATMALHEEKFGERQMMRKKKAMEVSGGKEAKKHKTRRVGS